MAISPRLCLQPILSTNGVPSNGALVYVYEPGTTTKINLFTDSGLSSGAENPMVADSGFVPLRFMATQAYKLVVTTSAGGSLSYYNGDNIDPGIPVGTGVLALVNGGTGGSTPTAARTNIEAAGSAEVADLAAEVAGLAGAIGSTERTGIATGTTDQRPASPEFGDIRANSTLTAYEAYTGAAWKKFALEDAIDNTYFAANSIAFPLQRSRTTSTATTAISASIPVDTSIPQIGEGTEIFSVSFTPRSASSVIVLDAKVRGSIPGGGTVVVAAFKDSDANAIAATYASSDAAAAASGVIHFRAEVSAASTSARTYSLRAGTSTGTFTLNNGSNNLGGLMQSDLIITEILAI